MTVTDLPRRIAFFLAKIGSSTACKASSASMPAAGAVDETPPKIY